MAEGGSQKPQGKQSGSGGSRKTYAIESRTARGVVAGGFKTKGDAEKFIKEHPDSKQLTVKD